MSSHITVAMRGKIEILLQENYTQKTIAKRLGVSPSSISREIKRGLDGNGDYNAFIAECSYAERRRRCRQIPKLDHPANHRLRSYIVERLQAGWDPSQISNRLKFEAKQLGIKTLVCAETIYQWIYSSAYAIAEKLYQYLRLGRKKRKRRQGRRVHTCKIPNRVSIHERPVIVDKKLRFGDWEGDSVLFNYKRAINTLNERLTGFVCFTKLMAKTADLTAEATVKKLKGKIVHTITFDNGSEFTRHSDIAQAIDCKIFFADPYSSYQRGANENINRQLRAYLPKRSSIEDLTQKELDAIAEELNNKPRKRLGWHTPQECYEWCMKNPKKPLQLKKVAFGVRI